jgi:effector-binding domain-containing protein
MEYVVEARQAPAQPIQIVRGRATMATLPASIRKLFDEFYAGFKGKGGLNIVYYPGSDVADEFEIECGVQMESGGNAATPAGLVATTAYFGPYNRMKPAHEAIHRWVRENGHKLAGPSWEVYGHWSDDPAQLRTDIFYLVGA